MPLESTPGVAVFGQTPNRLRKRYYIFIVSHDWDGQLRRIPIPVRYVVVFVAVAAVGLATLVGLAGSYTRMLAKVRNFNEMRTQQELLVQQLFSARQDAQQFKSEVASLGSLASEVSSLYNFKHNANLKDRLKDTAGSEASADSLPATHAEDAALYSNTLNNFEILQATALASSLPSSRWSVFGPGVWQPNMWPVEGRITSSFGARQDPITGEPGEFHTGLDISGTIGDPVHVTADGVVVFSGFNGAYGRMVEVDHGHGMQTIYAHLSRSAVTFGQRVDRDEVIGYVGMTGRATGPHLHYEVRINGTPVNPYRYLRP